MSEVYHLGKIDHPTEEQLHHFLQYASIMGDIALRGGMTPEEAVYERQAALARIGMGSMPEPIEKPKRLYEDREDLW